jgi:hypothetical protein
MDEVAEHPLVGAESKIRDVSETRLTDTAVRRKQSREQAFRRGSEGYLCSVPRKPRAVGAPFGPSEVTTTEDEPPVEIRGELLEVKYSPPVLAHAMNRRLKRSPGIAVIAVIGGIQNGLGHALFYNTTDSPRIKKLPNARTLLTR